MNVIWSPSASEALVKTAVYIRKEFGFKSKKLFLNEIKHTAKLLKDYPNLGIVEPLLEGTPVLYRSIVVNQLNKIVYFINEQTIEIVALWDTRSEPEAQTEKLKREN